MKSRNILTRLAGGLTLLASAVGLATADVVTEPERTIGLGYAAQAFFVPDGRHIATITEGGAVLWDKESAAVVRGVGVWRGEQLQAFSPDGKFLLGAPGTVAVQSHQSCGMWARGKRCDRLSVISEVSAPLPSPRMDRGF